MHALGLYVHQEIRSCEAVEQGNLNRLFATASGARTMLEIMRLFARSVMVDSPIECSVQFLEDVLIQFRPADRGSSLLDLTILFGAYNLDHEHSLHRLWCMDWTMLKWLRLPCPVPEIFLQIL